MPTRAPPEQAADGLFSLALQRYRQGALEQADSSLSELLRSDPDHFDALHLQGIIAARTGQPERAVKLIQKAIHRNERVAAAHRHLGSAMQDLGRLEEAAACYGRAIDLRGDFKEAFAGRALVLMQRGRHEEALADFDRAIALGADDASLYSYRASVLIDLRRAADAAASCEQAILRRPDWPLARANHAAALYLLGRHEQALAESERAVALSATFAEAHAQRGAALFALRRLGEALASLDTAVALQPEGGFAHAVRGLCLLDLQRPDEAVQSCDRAIALRPDAADARNTRGLALCALKRFDAAMESFDAAIALQPQVNEPRFNKGIAQLLQGDLERGWDGYERRPNLDRIAAAAASGRPLWDGTQEIAGKTILVYSEQGLGDTLQFCRFVKLLEARGARVVLSVQDCLCTLLRGLGVEVVGWHPGPRAYDFHCPLLSLPRAFRVRLGTIPDAVPYLRPDLDRVFRWRERLGTQGRLIGIRWQGSTGRADAGRSFPLSHFESIAAIPGVRLISLQKGAGSEQLRDVPPHWQVEDLGEDFEPDGCDAFLDVAAVMASLDLVITSDTSIAHLAGALGRPTWVALKHVPDWRWMLDCEHSPWYPSMRLFRQERPGDWEGVFARVRAALTAPA